MPIIAPHFWRESKAKFFKRDLFFITTPKWLRKLFPGCIWDFKTTEKDIYLSFDDGPHPTITPFVLTELKKHNAKATFFCIGDNVKKYPEIFAKILADGHTIGNHTMHHINGWKHSNADYVKNIEDADTFINSNLFRPPYGRIKVTQIKSLHAANAHRKIIMWSVLAGDWVKTLSCQKCYNNIINNTYPGCIIVFHDSEKAYQKMSFVLPKLLNHFSKMGYVFKKI